MTPHFKSLTSTEKILVIDIMKLERNLNFDQLKINEALPRIEKLEKNYVNVFRTKNPDLRHMRREEITGYNELLVK